MTSIDAVIRGALPFASSSAVTTSRRALAKRQLLLATSASLIGLIATPALAQTAAAPPATDDSSTLQEIVVTAQKRQETANSVPMSITAATGAQLEDLGIKQPRDLIKLTPSFTYSDSNGNTPIYTLRGVGFSDISIGGRPTVSIYVDEAPLPFAVETRGANLDLERVEVLKGPQGTLFGQNATGGAINYIAAKPTKSLEAGGDLSYGNYNAVDVDGYLSGPITNTLAVRVSGEYTRNDPWQRSYTSGQKNGAGDFANARFLAAWTPTDKFKVQLDVGAWRDHSDVQAGQLLALSPNTPAAALVPGLLTYPLSPKTPTAADFNRDQDYGRHNRFFQSNLRLDYSLPLGLTATSITAYSSYRERQLQDADGTALSVLQVQTTGKIESISEELRITGDFAGKGNFVIGGNYAHDRVLEAEDNQVGQGSLAYTFAPFGLPLFTSFHNSNNQHESTKSVFGNIEYRLVESLKVYGGVRYTRADNRYDGCTSDSGDGVGARDFGFLQNFIRSRVGLPPNPPIAAGACLTANAAIVPALVHNSLNESNVSWRGGVEWTPAQRILLYANVSKGYKAGGFPILGASSATQLDPAKQESVIAYEAGFKAGLLDRTLQLNGAVFYYDYRDKQILGQVLDPVFGPLFKLINVPRSDLKGAELQLAWTPFRGLTLNAGGSYIDSRILDNFTNYNYTGAQQNFEHEPFPNTPRWQAVGNAEYRFGVSQRLDAFVGGDLSYQSSAYSQLGEQALLRTKAYALLGLRAGVESKNGAWRLWAWGRNVTDTYYWTSANKQLDTITRFTGMPATYGVTLSVHYR